jgi:hypothetical protein
MFMIAFGVWDLVYYVGLKGMIGFPESLLSWDILFLLPVPWLGPVLAPVIVSISMIGAGLLMLHLADRGRPLEPRWCHWAGITIGALMIVVSFSKDYQQVVAGQMPEPFSWPLFAAGELLGLAALAHAIAVTRRTAHDQPAQSGPQP